MAVVAAAQNLVKTALAAPGDSPQRHIRLNTERYY